MCRVPACAAADDASTAAWSVGGLCSVHLGWLRAYYAASTGGSVVNFALPRFAAAAGAVAAAPIIEDFVKIHVLLQYRPDLCNAAIQALEVELTGAKAVKSHTGLHLGGPDARFSNDKGKANYVSVGRSLEYYEALCWFPPNRLFLSFYLSDGAFPVAAALGLNTDPGAGRAHGALSHRIQWHVIMRNMTRSFTVPFDNAAWTHSPIELFQLFNAAGQWGGRVNAWGKAMDQQANTGWGNPDNVLADLRASGLVLVKSALDRKANKLATIENDVATVLGNLPPKALRDGGFTGSGSDLGRLVERLIVWKKIGGPPTGAKLRNAVLPTSALPTDGSRKDALNPSDKLYSLALDVWKYMKNDATGAMTHWTDSGTKYKEREKSVLSRSDQPAKPIDNTMVANSRTSLNRSDYMMSTALGALPRDASLL